MAVNLVPQNGHFREAITTHTSISAHILKYRVRTLYRPLANSHSLKIQGTFGLLNRSALYRVGINPRRPQIVMPQKFLNRTDIVVGL